MLQAGTLEGREADCLAFLVSPTARRVRVLGPGDAGRARAERLIEHAYARIYGGVLREHYPTLVCVEDVLGRPRAAAGVRLAGEARLFLEQYLDEPVEVAAERAMGAPVTRAGVAEIGNLASEDGAASAQLFLALAEHLHEVGCSHASATATQRLRRRFHRLGFPTERLAAASPTRLQSAADWGDYYSCAPEVLIGAIAPALAGLRARHALACAREAA